MKGDASLDETIDMKMKKRCNMKTEIKIPPQYAAKIEQQAAEQGISVDEFTENAIRKYMVRCEIDAGE